jgi:hypothetical protein
VRGQLVVELAAAARRRRALRMRRTCAAAPAIAVVDQPLGVEVVHQHGLQVFVSQTSHL